jgi:hypothetical protein
MTVTAESLFRTTFLPLYPEDAKADLAAARARDANPANNPGILAHLADAARVFAEIAPEALGVPAKDLALDFTDASVHRLSAALTTERRDRLAGAGAAGSADNALFNFVVHGSAYVGECVARGHAGAWSVRRPLWESVVRLRSAAGDAELAVFHWWLKSLADDATASLADRYRAHVEVPRAKPEDLPVLAPPDRRLPKLAKPRYDALYKYLRAQLPELRDVGDDFPSPERFEELGLKSLSFLLVGGGRMLVLWGPSGAGLHAFWLTNAGFEKGAFWPCDAFPEPIVRAKDDKLEVLLSRDGKASAFELLWWGP